MDEAQGQNRRAECHIQIWPMNTPRVDLITVYDFSTSGVLSCQGGVRSGLVNFTEGGSTVCDISLIHLTQAPSSRERSEQG